MAIFGYSTAYLNNPFYYQGGQTAYKIFEPKSAFPEKEGDVAEQQFTLAIPLVDLLGNAIVSTDVGYVMPLWNLARLSSLTISVTGATAGALTANIGNNTSATAYASALDLTATAVTVITQATLLAASGGVGNNDSVVVTLATVTTPTVAGSVVFYLQYFNP